MTHGATESGGDAPPPPGSERRRGIDRAIMLLEALLQHRAPARPSEIARMIGAPRSTTYEIVNSLVAAELLEPVGGDGLVYFGRAMHLFGWAYSHHNGQYRRIVAAMDGLAEETGETVQICGLRSNKHVVLDCRDSPGPYRISSNVGAEVPIPWTASGHLLLSPMPADDIRALVPRGDFRLPDGRAIAEDAFLEDVALARQRDYSEARALADRFTWCMAAPIRSAAGAIDFTLCLVLPIDTEAERGARLLALLRERAGRLSLAGGAAA